MKEANKVPDNTYFRLRVVTFDNVPWVATMKKCEHYFPTMEFVKEAGTGEWRKQVFGKEGDGVGGMGGVGGGVDEGGAGVDDALDA